MSIISTPPLSRARKRERGTSGRCRASAAAAALGITGYRKNTKSALRGQPGCVITNDFLAKQREIQRTRRISCGCAEEVLHGGHRFTLLLQEDVNRLVKCTFGFV